MKKYTTVTEFLGDLDASKRQQVTLLRTIIKEAHPGLDERIKWNAPSYAMNGEDRLTFSVQNKDNAVKLVLHMGATRPENKKGAPVMPDESGLISWQSDIRGILSFTDAIDITDKQPAITDIITRWLTIVS